MKGAEKVAETNQEQKSSKYFQSTKFERLRIFYEFLQAQTQPRNPSSRFDPLEKITGGTTISPEESVIHVLHATPASNTFPATTDSKIRLIAILGGIKALSPPSPARVEPEACVARRHAPSWRVHLVLGGRSM